MSDHPLLNLAAAGSVIGTLIGWLPSIAALFGIVWYCVLIYDRFWGKGRAAR